MLPNLVVIGAMKSGTTSLHYYLSLHPEIFMSHDKEPTFFTLEGSWTKGRQWYEEQFPVAARIRGESSPDYTKYPTHDGVPKRMHSLIPDAKLVYLVRDPVERLVSHYVDAYAFGRVNRPLAEVLRSRSALREHFVACSKYYAQLEQYLPYYDPAQILVLSHEELAADRVGTLRQVFRSLGVDDSFESPGFERVLYPGMELRRKTAAGYAAIKAVERLRRTPVRRYVPRGLARPIHAFNTKMARPIARPRLGAADREQLIDEFRPDVDALRRFTANQFDAWCV